MSVALAMTTSNEDRAGDVKGQRGWGRGRERGRDDSATQRTQQKTAVAFKEAIVLSDCCFPLYFCHAQTPFPPHPSSTVCNLLTLIVVRAEGEWHLWTRNWIRAWQVSRTHTSENWVCNTVHAPVAGASSTFAHRRLLAADFDILSHYVDNLDVCLAHSRRIQFGENATSENLHIFCSRRKPKRKSSNFSTTSLFFWGVRGSFVRDLNVASFSIYQIKIVPQNCHWGRERDGGSGISWGWFHPSLNPIPTHPPLGM